MTNLLDVEYKQTQLEKCVYWADRKTSNAVGAIKESIELGDTTEEYRKWLYDYVLKSIERVWSESKFIDYELSAGMRNIFIGRIKSAWNKYINHYGIDYLPKFDGYG